MNRPLFAWALAPLFFLLGGCYTFSGISIDPNVKTINVRYVENRAPIVAPTLSPIFTQKLKDRITGQTGLTLTNSEEADLDMNGQITNYDVSVTAVQNTQTATRNRLSITVNIVYTSRKNEKDNFTQSFTRFEDFPAEQSVQTAETQLIPKISDALVEDIFNRAFANW
jgi:hypothetical protein